MFEYWSKTLRKIERFQCLNRHCHTELVPVSLLGLSKTEDKVELHILSGRERSIDEHFQETAFPTSQRELLKQGLQREQGTSLWSRAVFFGQREVLVKGAQSLALHSEELEGCWLLGEALRQGWRWQPFDSFNLSALMLTRFELELDWDEACKLSQTQSIQIKRESRQRNILLEQTFEMSVQHPEPISVFLPIEGEVQEIKVTALRLSDIWQEMADSLEQHRASGALSEAQLEVFLLDWSRRMAQICPKDKRLPLVIYEAPPGVSIQCYTQTHLASGIEMKKSGQAVGIGIIASLTDEIGPRGYPLKAAAILESVSPKTEHLSLEVFNAFVSQPLEPLVFE